MKDGRGMAEKRVLPLFGLFVHEGLLRQSVEEAAEPGAHPDQNRFPGL